MKQHRSKGVQSNSSPCTYNHCSTPYEQSFRYNIPTLIRKLLQTKILDTILKFINYIKGRKTYTTCRNHTSSKRKFKTAFLSPTLFYIYTADIPPPRAPVRVMAYTDDITITSTHTSTNVGKKYIQSYMHKVWTKQSHTKHFFNGNAHNYMAAMFTN